MNPPPSGPEFPRTRWSSVLQLRDCGSNFDKDKALGELCQAYWQPLYVYARRRGYSAPDAEDLTQGFFKRLLERNLFSKADPARGRLRSFLLGAFKNFISEEWRQETRQKRGGGQQPLSLQELGGDQVDEQAAGFLSTIEPETLFNRIWFEVLLEQALHQLQQEYRKRGKHNLFLALHHYLAWNGKHAGLAEVAEGLGMSAGALRVALLRMRHRFRELIEAQIAETVGSDAEATEEMTHLRRVLGG